MRFTRAPTSAAGAVRFTRGGGGGEGKGLRVAVSIRGDNARLFEFASARARDAASKFDENSPALKLLDT